MPGSAEYGDFYSRRAHTEGYVARSIYKLQEIQHRFGVLVRGMRVLDLGAAPGSWSQLSLSVVGPGGVVVAVDRQPLELDTHNLPNLRIIVGDLETPATIEHIRREAPFDAILCDAAPFTSGNRIIDCSRSAAMVEIALNLSTEMLRAGGNLVVKLFQGGDEARLQRQFKQRFYRSSRLKPTASRKRSFELYLIGIGLLGRQPA